MQAPVKVRSLSILTVVPNLYMPGMRVAPPRAPPPKLVKSGGTSAMAAVYAACMFMTAVVRSPGVGGAKLAAYTLPNT